MAWISSSGASAGGGASSKRVREITTTERTTGDGGDRRRAAIRKEQQYGDPRYMASVQWCIQQRCRILGLNAPTETRLTGRGGGPLVFSLEEAVRADRELEEADGDFLQSGGGEPLLPGSA
jgi:hypothetical protein